MKNKLGNVLLMGRKGCPYSKKLQELLKKNQKNFTTLKVKK